MTTGTPANVPRDDGHDERRHHDAAHGSLRLTEALLRQVIDLVPDMIFAKDRDGRFLLANRAHAEAYGISVEALTGARHADFHPEKAEIDRMLADDREVIDTGQAKLIPEESFVDATGRTRHLRTIKIPFTPSGIDTPAILGVATDISDRRLAEAALRESEERYRDLYDHAPDMLSSTDMDTKCIVQCNETLLEKTGFTREQFLGRALFDVYHPDSVEAMKRHIEVFELTGGIRDAELKVLRSDGTAMDISLNVTAVRDDAGRVIRSRASWRDITRRKRAEEALLLAKAELEQRVAERTADLRESEVRLRVLLAQLPAIVWTTGRDLRFTTCDGAALPAIGLQMPHVIGRNLDTGFGEDPPSTGRLVAHRAALGGDSATYKETLHGRTFEAHVEPLRNGNRSIVGCIGIALDVTERQVAEDQVSAYQQRLRSLAAELSLAEERERRRIAADLHDRIGQSLGVARLKLEGLVKTREPAERQIVEDCLGLLDQSIGDTRTLIFDLSPPVLYDLGFEAAAEWLVDVFRNREGLAVEYVNDQRPKPLSEAMRVTLFRAIRELLINIVKHAGVDRAELGLQREGAMIRVDVNDEGAGFGPGSSGGQPQGFGLFNIREQLVRLGGEVDVDSTPGGGTRVTLWAPIAADAPPPGEST